MQAFSPSAAISDPIGPSRARDTHPTRHLYHHRPFDSLPSVLTTRTPQWLQAIGYTALQQWLLATFTDFREAEPPSLALRRLGRTPRPVPLAVVLSKVDADVPPGCTRRLLEAAMQGPYVLAEEGRGGASSGQVETADEAAGGPATEAPVAPRVPMGQLYVLELESSHHSLMPIHSGADQQRYLQFMERLYDRYL